MRLSIIAAAAVLVLPLAACSSGSDSNWQDEFRQVVTEDFANASSENLAQSCQAITTNEIGDPQAYVDFLELQNPELTVDEWLTSLGDLHGADGPSLTDIVPDDATVDEVLTITGDVHIAECNSRE